MALEHDRQCVGVCFVVGCRVGAVPACATIECFVLDKDAVVQDDKFSTPDYFTFFVEDRAGEENVVSLPLTGFPAGVEGWFRASVKCAGLTVGVGRADVIVRVENLHFIFVHQRNAAIAAALAFAFGVGWRHPFEVELAGTKFLFGFDRASFDHNFHGAISEQFPIVIRVLGPGAVPVIHRFLGAIEQDDCI